MGRPSNIITSPKQSRQFKILVNNFGVSPQEVVNSLKCSDCGQWSTLTEWLCVFHREPSFHRLEGLKCPECGHFHSPLAGPIRFATI